MTHYIKHGGTLNVGDFICVFSKYGVVFGWYSGNGRNGTVQFVRPRSVVWEYEHFKEREAQGKLICNRDKQGFSLDHISKEFVKNSKTDNIVKVNDPKGLFEGEELVRYEQAVQILKTMRVLK